MILIPKEMQLVHRLGRPRVQCPDFVPANWLWIHDAFNHIGQHLFGREWNGDEIFAFSIEEVRTASNALKNSLKNARENLQRIDDGHAQQNATQERPAAGVLQSSPRIYSKSPEDGHPTVPDRASVPEESSWEKGPRMISYASPAWNMIEEMQARKPIRTLTQIASEIREEIEREKGLLSNLPQGDDEGVLRRSKTLRTLRSALSVGAIDAIVFNVATGTADPVLQGDWNTEWGAEKLESGYDMGDRRFDQGYRHILVNKLQLDQYLAPRSPASAGAQKSWNKMGRPAKWDWPRMIAVAAGIAFNESPTPERPDVHRRMMEWFAENNDGETPAESEVRKYLSVLWDYLYPND